MSAGQTTFDHQLVIDGTTKGLNLIKDDSGRAMYQVIEEVPKYQDPLKFTQDNWVGGHGQYEFKDRDVYYDGQSIDTTQEGKIFPGPMIYTVGVSGTTLGANPVCFCWYAAISKLMVATASKVFWYDGTNFVEKWDATAVGTISDMIEFNGILYVAFGNSVLYYYSSDGASFTVTNLTDGYAVGFFGTLNAAGTSNVLWKYKTTNQISSTTDGRATGSGGVQWSSPAYIGDTSNNITNLFLSGGNFLTGRTDNLYHYDSDGGIHPLMNDLVHNRSTNNFKYVTEWQTGVYFSLGTGMGELTSYDAFEPMGPLTNVDDIGKAGVVVGLASDKDWLYVVMDEGTNSHIYKGHEVRRGGVLRWEWCPWVSLLTNACATALVVQHSATDRRLWFGYGNNAGFVKIYDNPLADTSATYSTTSFIRMSYDYGTNPYWDKMFQSVVTETTNCTAAITVTPYYRKNAETSMTALTAAITSNGVVKTNLTSALSGNRFQFELDLAAVREPTSSTNAADAGTGATTLIDSSLTSTANDYYNGWYLFNVTRNLGAVVTDYVGSTKTITCESISGQVVTDTYYLTSVPPIVTFFEARGAEKPETVRIHEATYAIGDTPSRKTETIRSFLRGGRTSTSLIKFADLRYGDKTTGTAGTDYVYCVMLPGYPKEIEVMHEKGRAPELGIQCRFQEVSFS
jgi:hypothetical protein